MYNQIAIHPQNIKSCNQSPIHHSVGVGLHAQPGLSGHLALTSTISYTLCTTKSQYNYKASNHAKHKIICWWSLRFQFDFYVLFIVPCVACREEGSDWSILQPIAAPPSNVPGSHLGEMAFDGKPRDETKCFRCVPQYAFQFPSQIDVLSALRHWTKGRGMKAPACYTVSDTGRCMPEGLLLWVNTRAFISKSANEPQLSNITARVTDDNHDGINVV